MSSLPLLLGVALYCTLLVLCVVWGLYALERDASRFWHKHYTRADADFRRLLDKMNDTERADT